jgi:hypothetical protein
MEALQVEGEECASANCEESITAIRCVPLTARNEPEEGERYCTAEEGDNGGCSI